MRSLRSIAVVLSALALGALGAGCGEETDPKLDPEPQGGSGEGGGTVEPQDGKAMIRIVHASSDAPAVDIWVAGSSAPIAAGLSFGDASDWLEVDPGSYDVEIKASPSTAADPAVYSTGDITLAEGEKVSAVAAGLLGSTADASKFRVLPIREGFSPAGSGNAILRVVHASPDAPSVGIDLHDDDASSPELTNIDRFGSTPEGGFPLTAGSTSQIGIVATGGKRVTAFTTPGLPEGAEILVIATGLVAEQADEADGFALLAIGPDGALGFVKQNPYVYALHASPNAPEVDLYAGEGLLAGGLEFGEIAGPVQVPPGDYAIDFRPAGADPGSAPAASANTGSVEPGNTYLSIATGFLGGAGEQSFRLMSLPEKLVGASDDAVVQVVHGSPDAPMVDLGVLNFEGVVNPVLIQDLIFGTATGPEGLSIGLGTIPIGVTPAGANDTVVASFHVTTAPGLKAFAIASGALGGNGQSFRLLVVDTSSAPWTVGAIHPQPQ